MPLRLLINYGRPGGLKNEQDRPMSGIQTALLGLSTALARLGHDVHIFAPCFQPGLHEGVFFHDRNEFARFTQVAAVDVLVAIPEVLPLLMPVRARARVVWTLNAFQEGDCAVTIPREEVEHGGRGGEVRLYPIVLLHHHADRVIVGSHWQARHLAETCGIPKSKFVVTYLGVPLEHYSSVRAPIRHRRRLVYTSQARRGLAPLLQFFPEIRTRIPDAELHVFGYEYRYPEALDQIRNSLSGAYQPGVNWRGSLNKSALAAELRAAAVLAYPCTFKETFCLAVAEAQAAGLPVVTSNLAALAERVRDGVDGFLIPRRPGRSSGYESAFVEAIVRLLRDDDLWAHMGTEAAGKARRLYDWDTIAAGWSETLDRLVAGREPLPPYLDPPPDWLAPSLLIATDREASTQVSPALAKQSLRRAWASYGYDPDTVPGLPVENSPGRDGRLESTTKAFCSQGEEGRA